MPRSKSWRGRPTSAAADSSWRPRCAHFAHRRRRAASASISAPPPAASPTACCSPARRASTPWTSARDSSTGSCAAIRAWCVHEGSTRAICALEDIGEPVDLAVCDVSFISVTLILPAAGAPVTAGRANGYTGQAAVRSGQGPGGQGRNRARPAAAPGRLPARGRRGAASWDSKPSIMESPILGAEGNKEFLLYAHH